jgi:hypothetical protein
MSALMISLMITMTDVFYAIGDFSYKIFAVMKKIGHIPNVILWVFIFCALVYWTLQIVKQTKEAKKNGTYI